MTVVQGNRNSKQVITLNQGWMMMLSGVYVATVFGSGTGLNVGKSMGINNEKYLHATTQSTSPYLALTSHPSLLRLFTVWTFTSRFSSARSNEGLDRTGIGTDLVLYLGLGL